MKIVDVSAFYSPHGGGVRNYVERKLEHAPKAGHELVVVVPGKTDSEETRPGGARLVSVASPKLIVDKRYRYFRSAEAVHAILDAERPDVVEASSPWRTANIVASWKGDALRSMFMHADPVGTYGYRWFGQVAEREAIDRGFAPFWNHLRRACSGFDMVVCANPDLSQRMRAAGLPGVTTIPLGIEEGVFSPSYRSAELRAHLLAMCGLPETATLLTGVGRLSSEKRWPMVVEAVSLASIDRPLGLVLVGQGRDRAAILKAIGGNPHIRLIDGISDRHLLASTLASADALVHGCESETFGLVVAEAAASGLPLILPDEGGASGFADPLVSETYRAADAASLAEAIRRFTMRDIDAMAAEARRKASSVLSIGTHFDALFGAFEALGNQRLAA